MSNLLKKAITVHGERYDYSLISEFPGVDKRVNIICRNHGSFFQIAGDHIYNGSGCTECTGRFIMDKEVFIRRAVSKYGNRFDYSLSKYTNIDTKVTIVCPSHGSFFQTPYIHLRSQYGCPMCAIVESGKRRRIAVEEAIHRAHQIHGDLYDYSNVTKTYQTFQSSVELICRRHGSFFVDFGHHIHQGIGCSRCTKGCVFSKISLSWLHYVSCSQGIHIQHFGNGGEFKIQDSRYLADGYCKETNTIYEFQGCLFHVCIRYFPIREKPDTLTHSTPNELFQKTMVKRDFIRSLAYNFGEMWECDWKRGIKVVTKLQRLYRNSKTQ